MATLNVGKPIHFDFGGKLLIGADDVVNIVKGSMRITDGIAERLESEAGMDRGFLTGVPEGDPVRPEIVFGLKVTGTKTITEVLDTWRGRSTDGYAKTAALKVQIFDVRDGTTGLEADCGLCYLATGASFSAGAQLDTLEMTLRSQAENISWSAIT